jgi:hypothetical protein
MIHGYLGICAPSIQSAVLGEKDKLGGARETFGNPGRRICSKIHGWAGDRKYLGRFFGITPGLNISEISLVPSS